MCLGAVNLGWTRKLYVEFFLTVQWIGCVPRILTASWAEVKSCVSHIYHLLDQSIEGVHSKKWVGRAEEQSFACRA